MNSTTNGSSCYVARYTAQKVAETFAYCLIIVVSLIGNLIIAFIVYKTKTMRKPINYFIVNMAMSDFLFAIFVIPWQLTVLYSDEARPIVGPLGQALCKLVRFLTYISTAVSILSLVLIAVDRFGAVVFSLRPPLISSKLCPYCILATWIVAMAVSLPILFGFFAVFEYERNTFCPDGQAGTRYYFSVMAVAVCFVPLVVLAVLYSIILIKLKSQEVPGEQSANTEKLRARRNTHVLRMSMAIVLGFAFCWLPWYIFRLLTVFSSEVECFRSIYFYMHRITCIMALANCALNPCICFIFCKNYRQGLKRIFNCFGEL